MHARMHPTTPVLTIPADTYHHPYCPNPPGRMFAENHLPTLCPLLQNQLQSEAAGNLPGSQTDRTSARWYQNIFRLHSANCTPPANSPDRAGPVPQGRDYFTGPGLFHRAGTAAFWQRCCSVHALNDSVGQNCRPQRSSGTGDQAPNQAVSMIQQPATGRRQGQR